MALRHSHAPIDGCNCCWKFVFGGWRWCRRRVDCRSLFVSQIPYLPNNNINGGDNNWLCISFHVEHVVHVCAIWCYWHQPTGGKNFCKKIRRIRITELIARFTLRKQKWIECSEQMIRKHSRFTCIVSFDLFDFDRVPLIEWNGNRNNCHFQPTNMIYSS